MFQFQNDLSGIHRGTTLAGEYTTQIPLVGSAIGQVPVLAGQPLAPIPAANCAIGAPIAYTAPVPYTYGLGNAMGSPVQTLWIHTAIPQGTIPQICGQIGTVPVNAQFLPICNTNPFSLPITTHTGVQPFGPWIAPYIATQYANPWGFHPAILR
jgi:hypothetical protein